MAKITWPSAGGRGFWPAAHDEGVEHNVELNAARSGRITTRGLPGARWKGALQFPDESVANLVARRQLEAFLVDLRGGADRLLLWNLLTPAPLGSLRGSPVLSAGVAIGDATAVLSGCTGINLLLAGGFEVDGNADGVADAWSIYSAGTTGAITQGLVAGGSGNMQRVNAAGLGATTADQAGVRTTAYVTVAAGQAHTLAVDARVSGGITAKIGLLVAWYTAGLSLISSSSDLAQTLSSTTARKTATFTAPPTAERALVYLFVHSRTAGGALSFDLDNAQLEVGAAATAFEGGATLLRGDRIGLGVGGQRVMVTADARASDAGVMTVNFRAAARAAISGGTAVVWDKPTSEFIIDAPLIMVPQRADKLPGFGVGLVETWD